MRPYFLYSMSICIALSAPALAHAQETVTLEGSICTAMARNYQVRASAAKTAGQEYNVSGAFADLLPKAKFAGQYFRTGPVGEITFDLSSSFTPDMNKINKSDVNLLQWLANFQKFAAALPAAQAMQVSDPDQVSAQFRVEQPLFSLYPIWQGYEMQKDGLEMTRLARKATEQEVRSQVVSTYLGALKARKLLAIAREAVELIGQHLEQAKKFVAAGVAHRSDQLMAEVKLSEARNNAVRAENGLKLAKAGLLMLMGAGPAAEFEVVDIVGQGAGVPKVGATLAELQDMARARRSEIKLVERQVALTERSVNLAWSNYIPQSALVGSYGYQHGNDFMPDWSWAVGGVASFTIWDWLKTHDQVQAAKAGLQEAKENREYAREGVLLGVKQAYYDLRSAEEVISTGEAAIKEAEENQRVMKMKYEALMATTVEVLDATVMLSKARGDYYTAVYDYWTALARLARAVEADESAVSTAKPLAGACGDR